MADINTPDQWFIKLLEVSHAQFERLTHGMASLAIDWRPIAAFTSRLSQDEAKILYDAIPLVIGAAITKGTLPGLGAKNLAMAHFAREFYKEFSTGCANLILKRAGSPEDYKVVFDKAMRDVGERELVMDQLRRVHPPNCPELARLSEAERAKLVRIKFKDALEQQLVMDPGCANQLRAEFKLGGPAPRRKSALEILGSGGENAEKLLKWIKTLPADKRKRVFGMLDALDTEEELAGLVQILEQAGIDSAAVEETLNLLEDNDSRFATRKILAKIGEAAASGATETVTTAIALLRGSINAGRELAVQFRAFDAGLASRVAEQRNRALKPVRQPSRWETIKKFITFNPF